MDLKNLSSHCVVQRILRMVGAVPQVEDNRWQRLLEKWEQPERRRRGKSRIWRIDNYANLLYFFTRVPSTGCLKNYGKSRMKDPFRPFIQISISLRVKPPIHFALTLFLRVQEWDRIRLFTIRSLTDSWLLV